MSKEYLLIGQAGVFRVASELLLKGHNIYLPVSDTGIDLIIDNGKTIQVKCARGRLQNNQSINNSYNFSFHSWKRSTKDHHPHELLDVDYVICWAIDLNIFYVFPAELVRGKYTVRVTPEGKLYHNSKYADYESRWDLLD